LPLEIWSVPAKSRATVLFSFRLPSYRYEKLTDLFDGLPAVFGGHACEDLACFILTRPARHANHRVVYVERLLRDARHVIVGRVVADALVNQRVPFRLLTAAGYGGAFIALWAQATPKGFPQALAQSVNVSQGLFVPAAMRGHFAHGSNLWSKNRRSSAVSATTARIMAETISSFGLTKHPITNPAMTAAAEI
jgi:hypothetical protein